MFHYRRLPGLAVASVLLAAAGPAAAAESKGAISIELNRLQDVEGSCRLSLVFTNGLPATVSSLSIETVLFDKSGQVDRFLVLKSRPLPAGKIRVQQFDVEGAKCGQFGRLLLNDVRDCAAGELKDAACLERIRPSSRAEMPFVASQEGGQ